MGTSNLKSAEITSLDASPYVAAQAGKGAAGYLKSVSGFVTAVAADAAGSTYRLVRLRSNTIVKSVEFESEAQGAGKVQLSAYYSDSTIDGTAVANQGLVVPTTGAAFFSDDIDCSAAVAPANKLKNATTAGYGLDKRNQELWAALGLTTDPGGWIDVVAVVHTTAITTGTGKLGVRVDYVA